jgi:DNA-binding FadR family transcriptional regulator
MLYDNHTNGVERKPILQLRHDGLSDHRRGGGMAARGTGEMGSKVAFSLGGADLDAGAMAGASLSARVASILSRKIQDEKLAAGTRLPTENAMAQHFGVSRTVIREAIMTLKAEGRVETRQGLGAFVKTPASDEPAFHVDPLTHESRSNLLGLIEVRRGIEAEIAALAAVRRSPSQIAEIREALEQIEQAAAAGGDGVEEDVRFHLAIARATGNSYWVTLVEMFAPQLKVAVSVTRANEARRDDYAQCVRDEHERIVAAIAAGDPSAARAAAIEHMGQAAERVSTADHEFWVKGGGVRARRLSEKA